MNFTIIGDVYCQKIAFLVLLYPRMSMKIGIFCPKGPKAANFIVFQQNWQLFFLSFFSEKILFFLKLWPGKGVSTK